ncbi:MAG: translation elongation factor, partial [Podila humilis]
PHITRQQFTLVGIEDGFLHLSTVDGSTQNDIRVPDGELCERIQAEFESKKDILVTIIAAMGEQALI